MLLIPIRTESPVRRTPVVNYGLMLANILVFVIFDVSPTPKALAFKEQHFILNGQWPMLYQFITYQFSHADILHLIGNMLFLWVFGNSVNSKFGNVPYLLFYIGGGAFAGLAFAWLSGESLLGASGAIAAVTTAYMVLFPRSRILVLFVFFLIRFFEVPALLMIGLKIVLWDNVISPSIGGGAGEVAYSAHLAGYLYGFIGAMLMLAVKAIPRDQFDIMALMKRWNQRRAFRSALSDPSARAQAEYGRVARVGPKVSPLEQARIDAVTELRTKITGHLAQGEKDQAADLYARLVAMDSQQVLPATQQIEVARHFYVTARFPQAAAAFERYLTRYKDMSDAAEVTLLLGIVCARDLKQYESAKKHLEKALESVTGQSRREQAERWLSTVREALGESDADSNEASISTSDS